MNLIEQLKQKCWQQGAKTLSNIELLVIILGVGINSQAAHELATQLVVKHKTLHKIARLPQSDRDVQQLGEARYMLLQAAIELGRRYYREESIPAIFNLSSSKKTKRYLIAKMADFKQEVFGCIFLNAQHQVLQYEILFYGTITGAQVYPRIIAQKALEYNAAAVIFAHNHPSGDNTPSQHDINTTKKLVTVLKELDILVLDHFIIGNNCCISFTELGLL